MGPGPSSSPSHAPDPGVPASVGSPRRCGRAGAAALNGSDLSGSEQAVARPHQHVQPKNSAPAVSGGPAHPLGLSEVGSPPSRPPSASPGLERDKFDNKTVSFEEHIKFEHNMWNYLYFIVLVRVKNKTDYTGPESYVAQMIKVRAWGVRGRVGTAVGPRSEAAGGGEQLELASPEPPSPSVLQRGASGKSPPRVQVVSGACGRPVPGDPACGPF